MQQWEYCVITNVGMHFHTSFPQLLRLTRQGLEPVWTYEQKVKGMKEQDVVAGLVAKLGQEGWEMVGAGSGSANIEMFHTLYFKRPIEKRAESKI